MLLQSASSSIFTAGLMKHISLLPTNSEQEILSLSLSLGGLFAHTYCESNRMSWMSMSPCQRLSRPKVFIPFGALGA